MAVMQRFEKGQAREREIDMLQELTKQVEGHSICGKHHYCSERKYMTDGIQRLARLLHGLSKVLSDISGQSLRSV
jgi:NADH:ubiquinone oxidoreductase subunit F (NADH-binding)